MASVNDSAASKRLKQARLPFMTKDNKSDSGGKPEESLPVKKTSIAAKLARFAASPVPPPEDDTESTHQPNHNPCNKTAEDVILLSDDSNSVAVCETGIDEKKETEKDVLDVDATQVDTEKSKSDQTEEKPQETSLLESLEDSDYAESVSNDSDNPDIAEASGADDLSSKEANHPSCDGEDNSEDKSSDVNGSSKTPKATRTPKPKKMTPKMLEKEAERQRKREERQQEKEEKQREKEEKERQKAEAKAHKEFLRKLKQQALEAKAAMKKKAEEEKEQEKKLRAEEKQRIEEEKKRQEEEERKKKERVSQAFTSFFTPKAKKTQPVCVTIASSRKLAFEPFQIKAGMRLASILRTSFPEERKTSLTALLNNQSDASPTYFTQLKCSQYIKGKSGPTWPRSKETEEVEVIDDEEAIVATDKASVVVESHVPCKKVRAKLLKFHENRRPPYWGTWSKKPSHINPRRPFAKEDVFDYEVDSDDEWEEEEPGESVSDSEGEEKEPEDDYEVDNEFFVPHGYLSDEEARDDNDEVMSPERMKASLKAKEAEFEEERKKKTCHLKARLIGCIWMDQVENNPALQQVLKVMNSYRAMPCVSVPISLSQVNVQKAEDGEGAEDKKSESKKSKKKAFSDKDLPDLVRLFHGNIKNKKFLVKEFRAYLLRKYSAQDDGEITTEPGKDLGESEPRYTGPSLTAIENKAAEIAEWKHCNELSRTCWVVKSEVLESCGLTDQSATNSWQYVLPVKHKTKTPTGDAHNPKSAEDSVKEEEPESSKPKAKVSLIKQFMQPSTATQKDAGQESSESKPKKRIQLTPVAAVNKKPKLDTETVTLD